MMETKYWYEILTAVYDPQQAEFQENRFDYQSLLLSWFQPGTATVVLTGRTYDYQ